MIDTKTHCHIYLDPEKQFLLLINHIKAIHDRVIWNNSKIMVFVEHNLGFEAEHHERALRGLRNVLFYRDDKRQRVGILTTLQVKHAMCTLANAMLREKRISLSSGNHFISQDPEGLKKLLVEELEIYSYQFKSASTVFGKDQCSLSGKVGGMRDDMAILFQLAIYWTSVVVEGMTE